jgi:hypothetical protein
MLADPQAVTVSGTARTLPRIEERGDTFVYADVANGLELYVTQKVAKDGRRRSTISLQETVVVTDPLTAIKSRVPHSVSVVFSKTQDITGAQNVALLTALNTALSAATNALALKLEGGEK